MSTSVTTSDDAVTMRAQRRPGAEELSGSENTGRLNAYAPGVLLERLASAPAAKAMTHEATMVFVDISGFTKLSERLARTGREGAEHLVGTISRSFSVLLADAGDRGGTLIKFCGDALLLWFEGDEHAARACAAAAAMRRTLRRIGTVRAGASTIVLRMSVGVQTGPFQMLLVGGSHREYMPVGPSISSLVAMESHAGTGQILISEQTAAMLPERCLGERTGPGILLSRTPTPRPPGSRDAVALPSDAAVATLLGTALRAHLLAAPAQPEHRTATVSFMQFGEIDELIRTEGADVAAECVEEIVCAAQEAADRYEICILGSDIATDGGKLLFSAGAPRAVGDDEERMLLTMRHVIEARTRLPVRAGVNRGYTFTGEVGPHFRRTYAVMGDVVNLAARLCAKARWGTVLTTEPVISRTPGRFALTAVEPFMVKGKSRPIEGFEVGGALRAVAVASRATRLPLIGRDAELAILEGALARARDGAGALVELIGESGMGTSRLIDEARRGAPELRSLQAACESYTRAIPYIAWRELLRQLLGIGWDDPDPVALAALRRHVIAEDPDLAPWLPLLAIAIGAQAPSTREVDELAPDARVARLHDSVLRLLRPALTQPTLAVIEHLDLMDAASAALLDALAGHLAQSSWLVVGTRREHATGFVATAPSIVRVEVGPLSAEAAFALAEATPDAALLPPHRIALAVERAGGNPEFLLDLLAAATGDSGDLPDTIEAAASARIDALDPGDRGLVRRAAVLGLSFRATRLRHVLEPGADEPDAATWARVADSLADDGDGWVHFKSPILCEAAYSGLPFDLRRSLHAAIGEALEVDRDTDVDADPAVLSLHFSRAGDHDRAWRYALIGAQRATERFAIADAVHLYRRAIDAHRGANVAAAELARAHEALGEALSAVGEIHAAEHAFASAARLAREDPVAQARICFRRGQIAERNELSRAVRWMNRGLRMLEEAADDEARRWRARLIADLAWIRQRQRRHREAERLCRAALTESEAIGELRAQARASYTLDWALFELGRFDEASHSARALEIYRELGDPEHEARVLNNLGGLAYWRGRWQDAIELYRQAGICSERAGHAADVAFTDGNLGEILADQGLLEQADVHLRRAHRVWTATGDLQGAAFANILLGRLAARAGRREEAAELLSSALADMERFRVDFYVEFARALLAEADAIGGDPTRAFDSAGEQLKAGSSYVSLLRRIRGIALARLGELEASAYELELALAVSRERDETFDVALALDALDAIGSADNAMRTERDAIFARLGVVAVAPVDGLRATGVGSTGVRSLTAAASS